MQSRCGTGSMHLPSAEQRRSMPTPRTPRRYQPIREESDPVDFFDGAVQALCTVDLLNEGIDVPDVNIIVFQRVTHSRRIFVQQLGRGLRLAPDKESVIVLDFVSDIRRFAAGLELKDDVETSSGPKWVSLPNKVTFQKVGGADEQAESFLREWLEDVASIEAADEDASVLKFPPAFSGAS